MSAEQERLLAASKTASQGASRLGRAEETTSYGAIENDGEVRSSEEGEPYKRADSGQKVNKTFKEIWPMCLGLSTAVFCSALGATVVANVQVDIGSYFRAGSLSSWLGTSYLLGLAAMTPLYGRLAEVMGRKGAMLLAVSLFFVGTLCCAIAPSMMTILVARGIAGAGSGGILTVTVRFLSALLLAHSEDKLTMQAIIITDLVSIADRGLYQGGVNVLFGAGAAVGAVVGGAIADALGWRAAFWMQVPLIAFAAALIVAKVNVSHHKGDKSAWEKIKGIDWAGSVALVFCITSLSVGTSLATSSGYPWDHPAVISLLVAFVLSIPVFTFVERRAAEPILPLSLLTRAQPSLILVGFAWLTAANFSRIYMQPVYLHVARALNGSQTGLLLLPMSIVGSAASLYAGWHMRHYKEYKWFQFAVSLIPWLQGLSIIASWAPDTNKNRLWVEMAVGSLGGGAVITTLLTSMINCVESNETSLAISACYLFRSLGQVLGVAVSAAIQQSVLVHSLAQRLPNETPELIRQIIQEPSSVIPRLSAEVQLQARMSYLESIRGVFGFVVLGGVVLSGICLGVRARPLT